MTGLLSFHYYVLQGSRISIPCCETMSIFLFFFCFLFWLLLNKMKRTKENHPSKYKITNIFRSACLVEIYISHILFMKSLICHRGKRYDCNNVFEDLYLFCYSICGWHKFKELFIIHFIITNQVLRLRFFQFSLNWILEVTSFNELDCDIVYVIDDARRLLIWSIVWHNKISFIFNRDI